MTPNSAARTLLLSMPDVKIGNVTRASAVSCDEPLNSGSCPGRPAPLKSNAGVSLKLAAFALAEFLRSNLLHKAGQRRKDAVVETVSTLTLLVFTQPFVLFCGALLAATLFPDHEGALASWPILGQIGLFPARAGNW